ncbi:MAG: GNAT family N-acetyltransferase [Deltaproteobacteria bacterium]|nr:GNAT family N-acetyltransferase [Deltaproteobacteria bacterium]
MVQAKELFKALELAHYASRFRDKVFVVALPREVPFSELLLDVKVLAGYRIQVVLVTRDVDYSLDTMIAQSNRRGSRFHLLLLTEILEDGLDQALDFGKIRGMLAAGKTCVIAYHPDSAGDEDSGTVDSTAFLGGLVARRLEAQKLFLVHPRAGEIREAAPRSHLLGSELDALAKVLGQSELEGTAGLVEFIADLLKQGVPDVVLMEGRQGELYQEVFTHDGAGLLCNNTRTSRVRPAVQADITDIALLLRPEVEAGRILPVSEEIIEGRIGDYFVYEIDGLLVGLARLRAFGEAAELSQFATLPRYRGKGRARELARRLVEAARERGFQKVFALSIDERMWEFFTGLGFSPVERELLPGEWKRNYDMSRPSRAFLMEF